MACDITKGKALLTCKDAVSGLKAVYIANYDNYDYTVSSTQAGHLLTDLGDLDVVYKFELKNSGNTFNQDITSSRDALNGYQKGKCFYSFQDISINPNDKNLCHVDHFFPHVNILNHYQDNANLNGVWNLVLADKKVNANKLARIPHEKYLLRLFNRNEFYIESKHPLAETIVNQTGNTKDKRARFLQNQYRIALENSSQVRWKPEIELKGTF